VSALPSIAPDTGRPVEADAAADLYARHSSRIFGYCLGLLRNREEAEDAVQTTFLNAYRGLRRGVQPDFEAAWLFKIAQNVCRTRRENAWRCGRVETVRDLDTLQDAVAAPEHANGQAAELTAALNALPERYRTIILLREWHGLSYREIAVETGLSEGAVEMLVFRARRALAEQLQGDGARARALSLSSVLSVLKSVLGGAGLKAAATAVAVTATAIAVATVPSDEDRTVPPTGSTPTVERPLPAVAPPSATARPSHRRGSPAVAPTERPDIGHITPPTAQAAAGGTGRAAAVRGCSASSGHVGATACERVGPQRCAAGHLRPLRHGSGHVGLDPVRDRPGALASARAAAPGGSTAAPHRSAGSAPSLKPFCPCGRRTRGEQNKGGNSCNGALPGSSPG
jgi:RNA polymerase sigma-70 factor, ECF subfamily